MNEAKRLIWRDESSPAKRVVSAQSSEREVCPSRRVLLHRWFLQRMLDNITVDPEMFIVSLTS